MNSRSVTGLLLAVNLALAGGVGWLYLHRTTKSTSPAAEGAGEHGTGETGTGVPGSTSATGPAASRKEARFTWRAVASRDLKAYIAKLRGVKCPEETIQDIILAEVDRIYVAKEAALGFRTDGLKPWETSEVSRERDFGKLSRLRQLRVEKRNLIFELLGIDVAGDIPSLVGSNFNSAWEQALAMLPLEKRGPVRAAQDKFWERTETLRRRVDGFLLPEDAEEYRKARNERLETLRKILTPDEFDQVEMRTSTTGRNLRNELTGFEPNEAEFRAIFRARRDQHESTYLPGQLVGAEEASATQATVDAASTADQQIKAALGEVRYAEFQRSQNWEFQQIQRIAQDSGLPKETAIAAYEMQNQTQARVQQALQTPGLTAEQQRQMVQQIQAEAIQQVKQAFGDKAFQQLQQRMPGRFLDPAANRQQFFPGSGTVRTFETPPAPPIIVPVPTP